MGRNKGSGAGSVYKRGDKWRGQITVDGVRLSHTADKKKDVLDWIASVRNQKLPRDMDYTVKEWFEIYFEKYFRPRVKDNTFYGGKRLINAHLYPTLGEMKLRDLTSEVLQNAIPEMFSDREYSDGTYRTFRTRVKDGFDYAVYENIIDKNPAANLIMPKKGIVKKVEAFTSEEQKKIVDYCKPSKGIDRIYYFLIATGVRVGEAICLTWDDVNLDKGYVDINKTAIKVDGGVTVQNHPKTGQSVRRIYLSDNTIEFIKKLEETSREGKDLVFPNRNGNIYNVSTLRQHWMKTCEKLKIPYKSMHALRHSWATRALESHIDVQTVSKMLGHKSVATTMDIYQSIFSEQKIEAAKIMNQFV